MQKGIYFTRSVAKRSRAQNSEHVSEIVANKLYLGDVHAADDRKLLKRLGITHIVNMCEAECFHEGHFEYKHFPIKDGGQDLLDHISSVHDFIKKAQVVFVHCQMGMSRSASMVMAYLMATNDMTYKEAHDYVKEKRPQVKPHFYFEVALEEFERSLEPSPPKKRKPGFSSGS